jgi:hypothetical protein
MKSILALKESVFKISTILLPFLITTPDSKRAIFLTLARSHNGSGIPLPGSPLQACEGFFFSESTLIGISKQIDVSGVAVSNNGPILLRSVSNLPVIGKEIVMNLDQMEIPLSRLTTKAKNRFGKRIQKTFKRWTEDRKEKKGRAS